MQILTPDGYKSIKDIQVGDDVLAFDMVTGEKITNQVLEKELWNTSPETPFFNGEFYLINNEWKCYGEQSIWRNDNQVVHINELAVGDIVFDGEDKDVTIISIEKLTDTEWYRFEISGDHSYIVDNLTLHNASRFWVGGTGTWSSSNTTNWAATSGGAGGQSVPASSDTATIDASSGAGTITPNYDFTVTSITCGAMGMTLDFSANNNRPTMSTFSGTGTGTRTINLGSGTFTLTGSGTTIWTTSTSTNLTLNGSSATIICSYSGGTGTRSIANGTTAPTGTGFPSLNITAGTDTVSITNGTATPFVDIIYTGFSGTASFGTGSPAFTGNYTNSSAMTYAASGQVFTYLGTGSKVFTTAGVSMATKPLTINGTGSLSLGDNCTLGGALTITQGTFNANNFNLTATSVSSSNSNTRSILMGSGTWTLTSTGTVWTTSTSTNLTLTPSTSTIVISDTSATGKTFTGGGKTFWNITFTGDNITVAGSNTFNQFRLANAGLTTGLLLTAGTTQTVSGFSNNGTAGNLTKLLSTSAGTPATLSKSSGNVSTNYMSIKDSTATGGAVWYAGANSTDVSGNTGWIFSNAPSGGSTIGNNLPNAISNAVMV